VLPTINDRADPRLIVVFVLVEPCSPPAAGEGCNPRHGIGVGVGVGVCTLLGNDMGERRREMGEGWTIKEDIILLMMIYFMMGRGVTLNTLLSSF
jgi:hypothetical protein